MNTFGDTDSHEADPGESRVPSNQSRATSDQPMDPTEDEEGGRREAQAPGRDGERLSERENQGPLRPKKDFYRVVTMAAVCEAIARANKVCEDWFSGKITNQEVSDLYVETWRSVDRGRLAESYSADPAIRAAAEELVAEMTWANKRSARVYSVARMLLSKYHGLAGCDDPLVARRAAYKDYQKYLEPIPNRWQPGWRPSPEDD